MQSGALVVSLFATVLEGTPLIIIGSCVSSGLFVISFQCLKGCLKYLFLSLLSLLLVVVLLLLFGLK